MKQRHAIDEWGAAQGGNGESGRATPLVLSLSARGTRANATIVEITSGTSIRVRNIQLDKRLVPLLEAKKREVELLIVPTARAIEELRKKMADTNAILHVTC